MDTINTETLNQLLVCNIPEVVEMASKTTKYAMQLHNQEITKDEFDDLIDDLTRIDNIDRSMISLERYREIMTAIAVILKLKSIVSLF